MVKSYDDIGVGDVEVTEPLVADRAEMIAYARSNDPYSIHTDPDGARAAGFDGVIASFGYTVSLYLRLTHRLEVVRSSGASFSGAVNWHVTFGAAVEAGDAIRMRHTVLEKRITSTGDRGLITSRNELLNQRDEIPVSIDAKWLIALS